MARGDHIFVRRYFGLYSHHGIDCGDGSVIHFTGEPGQRKGSASIARTGVDDFLAGGKIKVRRYGQRDTADIAVERAESRLGEAGYDLAFNNCEHFAAWCCTGREQSHQVRGVSTAAASGVVTASTAASTAGVVAAAGVTKGLSGAGLMSGLAAFGRLAGGGAALGPTVIGALPTTVTLGVIHRALRDDDSLPPEERLARRDGRRASVVGAVTATAGGAAAIKAAGLAGVSAAGVSSGLASIGATVGGGMAAGTVIVATAPAAIVGTAAVGIFFVSRSLRRRLAQRDVAVEETSPSPGEQQPSPDPYESDPS
jgi:hypothetical protein